MLYQTKQLTGGGHKEICDKKVGHGTNMVGNHCSIVKALHTVNNTVAKGFNQMSPPARTITVALDMSNAFDTINIHTLIGKLPQTNIPGTIIKFTANYIKGRKAYTTYRNYKKKVLSPTLFNIYTADIPPPRPPVQVMAYAQ